MSGGSLDYGYFKIEMIAEQIEGEIKQNNRLAEYGYADKYRKEVIEKMKEAINKLKEAAIYAKRVEWLVSGDDSEESFLDRLSNDLKELKDKQKC
jgi:hypothetical protein